MTALKKNYHYLVRVNPSSPNVMVVGIDKKGTVRVDGCMCTTDALDIHRREKSGGWAWLTLEDFSEVLQKGISTRGS